MDVDVRSVDRWHERRVLAVAVRVVALLVPVAAAVATSAVLSRRLERPHGAADTIATWGLLLGVSGAVLVIVDRLARRLLPLAALLRLSLAFPDKAPSRFSIALRRGSIGTLRHQLHHPETHGLDDEPRRAAETILALSAKLSAHDRWTRGHSERVRAFTDLIAEELHLPAEDRDRLRWVALLHDVGKLQVSPRILNKASKPTAREWAALHRHPVEGARLAAPLRSWLGDWTIAIEQHHEAWDGSGYPRGLSGDGICLGARIIAVADAYEVMTAGRSYQRAVSPAAARRELTAMAGSQFDPAAVRAFLNVSLGRTRRALGPLAWLGQVPFIGWVSPVAGTALGGGSLAGAAGTAAGVALLAAPPPAVDPIPVPEATPAAAVVPAPSESSGGAAIVVPASAAVGTPRALAQAGPAVAANGAPPALAPSATSAGTAAAVVAGTPGATAPASAGGTGGASVVRPAKDAPGGATVDLPDAVDKVTGAASDKVTGSAVADEARSRGGNAARAHGGRHEGEEGEDDRDE